MDGQDPISQFFPDEENVDLYAVLNLTDKATTDEIKKSYRRLALIHHPDKHTTANEQAKVDASIKFQQIGFAYTVLSDEKRREKYDKTGSTIEGFDLTAGEDGWEAYFEDLFERVTRGKLDEMKKEYQGSSEEFDDLKSAYIETKGSIGEIMTHIPHSTIDDEPRFIIAITDLIKNDELPKMPEWEKSIKDEKARLVRKKESEKEAKEAEALAKDLGVWDEFYGSGKTGERKTKSKAKSSKSKDEDEEDTSALQALILKRNQAKAEKMDSFFDGLAEKYSHGKNKGKGKKRGRVDEDEDEISTKKARGEPPEIDEEEFAKLQEKLFGDNAKVSKPTSKSKPVKGKRGRKATK